MKIMFKDVSYTLTIGAKPFGDITKVAEIVIQVLDATDIVEDQKNGITQNLIKAGYDCEYEIEDDTIHIRSLDDGAFDVEDNDKLHNEWLLAFNGYLDYECYLKWYTDDVSPQVIYS